MLREFKKKKNFESKLKTALIFLKVQRKFYGRKFFLGMETGSTGTFQTVRSSSDVSCDGATALPNPS